MYFRPKIFFPKKTYSMYGEDLVGRVCCFFFFCFFFPAEDGIRDLVVTGVQSSVLLVVTGVQTCALPIWAGSGEAGTLKIIIFSIKLLLESIDLEGRAGSGEAGAEKVSFFI